MKIATPKLYNMELKINLLEKKKKSLFRVILGIGCVLIVSSWILFIFIERGIIRPFDWFYFGIFMLNGVIHFVEGLGYSLESLFGKAYILINSEIISLKSSAFDKEQSVNWNEIKSIYYKIDRFNIKKTDDTTIFINISKFDYKLMRQIKETVDCIAKAKNIQIDFWEWNK